MAILLQVTGTERNNRLGELVEMLREERPHLDL